MRTFILFAVAFSCLSAHASAKDINVKSWCPITGAVGVGKGPTFGDAKNAAIKACLSNGGLAKCCTKFYRQV